MKTLKGLVVILAALGLATATYTGCGFFTNDSSLPGAATLPSGEGGGEIGGGDDGGPAPTEEGITLGKAAFDSGVDVGKSVLAAVFNALGIDLILPSASINVAKGAGPVCGDKICDVMAGEDDKMSPYYCPDDCEMAPPPSPVCGDGRCETPETSETCPEDCDEPVPLDPLSVSCIENYNRIESDAVSADCAAGPAGLKVDGQVTLDGGTAEIDLNIPSDGNFTLNLTSQDGLTVQVPALASVIKADSFIDMIIYKLVLHGVLEEASGSYELMSLVTDEAHVLVGGAGNICTDGSGAASLMAKLTKTIKAVAGELTCVPGNVIPPELVCAELACGDMEMGPNHKTCMDAGCGICVYLEQPPEKLPVVKDLAALESPFACMDAPVCGDGICQEGEEWEVCDMYSCYYDFLCPKDCMEGCETSMNCGGPGWDCVDGTCVDRNCGGMPTCTQAEIIATGFDGMFPWDIPDANSNGSYCEENPYYWGGACNVESQCCTIPDPNCGAITTEDDFVFYLPPCAVALPLDGAFEGDPFGGPPADGDGCNDLEVLIGVPMSCDWESGCCVAAVPECPYIEFFDDSMSCEQAAMYHGECDPMMEDCCAALVDLYGLPLTLECVDGCCVEQVVCDVSHEDQQLAAYEFLMMSGMCDVYRDAEECCNALFGVPCCVFIGGGMDDCCPFNDSGLVRDGDCCVAAGPTCEIVSCADTGYDCEGWSGGALTCDWETECCVEVVPTCAEIVCDDRGAPNQAICDAEGCGECLYDDMARMYMCTEPNVIDPPPPPPPK